MHGETIPQVKLIWVVSGPHSEAFPMRDIHVQNVWMRENQEKSRPEWIQARCYGPGKGTRMHVGRQGQGIV